MATMLADVKLRWYDDSALLEDEPRALLEHFLDSIGITSDVARDLFEVMLLARARDVPLTTAEVKEGIIELRRRRAVRDTFGLTDRNIQIWLRYFQAIGMFDTIDGRNRFASNKKPLEAFERTKNVVRESLKYSDKLLSKLHKAYRI